MLKNEFRRETRRNFTAKIGFSRRKNSPIKRLNFPLAGEILRWFRREKSQVISANCAKVGF